jgi:uncharacterized protein YbjT (DUF2867 family)
MGTPILVTGGTGTIGRLVVPRLLRAGGPVRVLSRRAHPAPDGVEYAVGDIGTGDGLDAALDGVETVVHLAGSAKGDDEKARHLVRAATRAGGPYVVNVSVVGAERVPVVSGVDRNMFGYFAAKRTAERVFEESGLPWTTLRATQLHQSLVALFGSMARFPVVPAPAGVRFQPVDGELVADRLVELALGRPAGLLPDLAGPRAYPMADLIRSYLRATGRRRLVLPVPAPGGAARAVKAGANLPVGTAGEGRTWEEFLAGLTGKS